MRIIEPSVTIVTPETHLATYLSLLETCGAVAYRDQHTPGPDTASDFVRQRVIEGGHLSILEHLSVSARFVCDRSASHQLVRHRLGAYTQESQRITAYQDIEVICPPSVRDNPALFADWTEAVQQAEARYRQLLAAGIAPEDARSLLPNCMSTTVVATFNLRQWRHVFLSRALNPKAQWQIRHLMLELLRQMNRHLPQVFADLEGELLYNFVFKGGAGPA